MNDQPANITLDNTYLTTIMDIKKPTRVDSKRRVNILPRTKLITIGEETLNYDKTLNDSKQQLNPSSLLKTQPDGFASLNKFQRQTTMPPLEPKRTDTLNDSNNNCNADTCWKKLSKKVSGFLHSLPFSTLTTSIIVLELFLDDLRILLLPKEIDRPIDLFIFASALLFCCEILLSCLFVENYLFSFFNFVDILSTASLIPYVSSVSPDTDIQQFTFDQHSNSILSVFLNNTHITKTSKASLMGTKLSRLYSILRVLRVFSLGRIYKHNLNKIINKTEKIVITSKKKQKFKQQRRKSMNIKNFEDKMKFFMEVHKLIKTEEKDVETTTQGHLNPIILKNFQEYAKLNESKNKIKFDKEKDESEEIHESSEDGIGPKIFLSNIVQNQQKYLGSKTLVNEVKMIDPLFTNELIENSNTIVNQIFRSKSGSFDAEDELDLKKPKKSPKVKVTEKPANICPCNITKPQKNSLRSIISQKKDSITSDTNFSSNINRPILSPILLGTSLRVDKKCHLCGRIITPSNINETIIKSVAGDNKDKLLSTILSVRKEKKLQFNDKIKIEYANSSDESSKSSSDISPAERDKPAVRKSSKSSKDITTLLANISSILPIRKKKTLSSRELEYFKFPDLANSISPRKDELEKSKTAFKMSKVSSILKDDGEVVSPCLTQRTDKEKRSSAFYFLDNISPAKKSVISAQTLYKQSTKQFILNEPYDVPDDLSIRKHKRRPTRKQSIYRRSKLNIADDDDCMDVKFFKAFPKDSSATNKKLAFSLSKTVTIKVVFIILIILFVNPIIDEDNYNSPENLYQYEVDRLADFFASGRTDFFYDRLHTMLYDEEFISDNDFEVVEFGFSDVRLRSEFNITDVFNSDVIFHNETIFNSTRVEDRIYVDNAYFYLVYNDYGQNQLHAILNILKICFIGFNLWCFSFFFMLDINKTIVVPLEELFNTMRNRIIKTETLYYDVSKDVEKFKSNYEEIFGLEKFFRYTSSLIIRCIGIRFYNFFVPRILAKVDHSSKKGIFNQLKGVIMVIKLRQFDSLIKKHGENFMSIYSKVINIIDVCVFENFGEVLKIDGDTIIIFFDINFLDNLEDDVKMKNVEQEQQKKNTLDAAIQSRENLKKTISNFSLMTAIRIHSRLKHFNFSVNENIEINITLHKGRLNLFLINTTEKLDICIFSSYLKKCIEINVNFK
jgi:hypothetical protein